MSIARKQTSLVFQKLERDLRKLCTDQQAASVHAFRTTTRRAQTLLEELLPKSDRNQKKLLKLLGRIRKRAGKVRDLDVQLAALRSLKVAQEPRRKTQLMQGLLELRAQHERKLCKSLTKQNIREIHKRLKRTAKGIDANSCREPLSVARQMLAQIARPAGPPTEEVLHQYRIVVKRARYAAEFALPSQDAARFVAPLKRLQDAIGNWHDWLSLLHTAADRLGDVNQSSLVAALQNVTRGKFRTAIAALEASPTVQAPGKVAAASSAQFSTPGTKADLAAARTDSAA